MQKRGEKTEKEREEVEEGQGTDEEEGQGTDEEEGEGGEDRPVNPKVLWTEKGIPHYAGTKAYERRNKKTGGDAVSLAKDALEVLPSLDDFMSALDPVTGKLPLQRFVFRYFDTSFPRDAVQLITTKVCAVLCVVFFIRAGWGSLPV